MWDIELDELGKEIDKEVEKYMKSIIDDADAIFLKAIVRAVYLAYTPKVYHKDNRYEAQQLLNSITHEIKYDGINTVLKVFINSNLLNYTSVVSGKNVSSFVPYWINNGHKNERYKGDVDQFHYYTPRNYLELAKQLIEKELNVEVEIVNILGKDI